MMSVVGFGTLVLAGVAWLWGRLAVVKDNTIYWQSGMAVALLTFFGLLLYWLFGRHQRIIDFLIATEAEMKKVNWPSKREIRGSTCVVIVGTLLIAALLFVVDLFFGWGFLQIRVLESTG